VTVPPFMRVDPVMGSGPITGVNKMLFASLAASSASATSDSASERVHSTTKRATQSNKGK